MSSVSLYMPVSSVFRSSVALLAATADERALASKMRSAAYEKKMLQRERLAKKKAAEQLKAANAKEREKKAKARKLALAVAAKEKAVAKKLKEKAEYVKRALSPYALYVKDQYATFAEKHKLPTKDLMKVLSEAFKKLTDVQKAPYLKLAAAEKERSAAERAEKKTERGKTLKTSPYMLFVKAERPKLVAANPQLAFGEVGRKLGEKWRALTEAQKSKYVAAAEKLDQQK